MTIISRGFKVVFQNIPWEALKVVGLWSILCYHNSLFKTYHSKKIFTPLILLPVGCKYGSGKARRWSIHRARSYKSPSSPRSGGQLNVQV